MMSNSIRHGFDQDTLFAFYRSASGFSDSRQNGQSIITVNSDGVETITRSSGCDTISGILVDDRCGDGESIISLVRC
jgi:hypothetical protein